jgi:16S rRNA (guanine527-N7)-methyltransferase
MKNLEAALKILEDTASGWGLRLDTSRMQQLELYLDRLLLWNERAALVSQREPVDIACKHFADSLYAACLCRESERVVDLGTGAGFPGLVIAIVRPQSSVMLIDSKRKKISFLTDVISSARLTNVRAVEARIDSAALDPQHARQYRLATSRALTSTKEFLALAQPFLRAQGRAIAMKGPLYQQELDQLNPDKLGFNVPDMRPYQLPDGSQRVLLEFKLARSS